jgi:hypothetical protein
MRLHDKMLSWLGFFGILKFVETPNNYGVGGAGNPVSSPSALSVTANVVTPTGLVSHVGAGLIKTITVPWVGFGGFIVLIADAVFTWDATGNIALAGTSTAIGRAILFTYDQVAGKWYPTVVA